MCFCQSKGSDKWTCGAPKCELALAYDKYWSANSREQERAAYCEILLNGGMDGYGCGGWRDRIARWLRIAAVHIAYRP